MNAVKKSSFIPSNRRPEVVGATFKRSTFSHRTEARNLIQRYMESGSPALRELVSIIYPGLDKKIPRRESDV